MLAAAALAAIACSARLAAAAESPLPAGKAGIAMHGEPELAFPIIHLPYVNEAAVKGGRLTVGFLGTFDSLNPFNLKAGSTAQGLISNVFEPLMMRSLDEPFSLYGLIAQTIETDEERSFVTFRLDPRAHFSDGAPITSDDVRFTFELLKTKGRPQQRAAYSLVKSIATPDAHTVRFDLSGVGDREMPLILALMPVLPRHKTDRSRFDDASLAIPTGSGPYVVESVTPGERLILRKDPNYWARDLPIRAGHFNFDQIDIQYFRDANSLFEAFAAGIIDFREETNPARWAHSYDLPAVRGGRVIRESLPLGGPKGMEGFVFNLRRPQFSEIRVREALSLVFDFDWINANLFDGLYKRTKSFFDESELASTGRPASEAERALLAPFPGAVRDDILEGRWQPPSTGGNGADRIQPRRAFSLLKAAGYQLEGGRLIKQGSALAFEIMVKDRSQERLALNYADSLARIGVEAKVRLVDEVQYQRRRQKFDFDMMIGSWLASASPGNEQRSRWGSASASQEASFNLAGVRSPAVDALINALLAARTREEFVTAVRAYDRVLLSGFYVVPLFHSSDQWIAYSSKLARPSVLPRYGPASASATLDTWWRKEP
ncbi:MAG: ABC transporter substrate-binding protein [Methylocapsa sp.]|nr:ABC transporter substrate-binding protein [Methylocapsa sp.]